METGTTSPAADDQFVYAISHDLRGPLLNFQGFLRRLSDACHDLASQAGGWNLTAEQRHDCDQLFQEKVWPSLEVLERNARRMDRLLTALLKLSRAGGEPVQCEVVETTDVVRSVVEEFRAAASEEQAVLTVEPLPDAWADAERLRHVFQALLENALKFLRVGRAGRIVVGGEVSDREVLCWVRDNGIGIKSENLARIFLPFGRLREMEAPGEGVGLAIARKLMAQQNGRIWVESAHGEGSTFYLAFPADPPAGGI